MRTLFIPAVVLGMLLSDASFAQSSTSSQAGPQASQQRSSANPQTLLTSQMVQQDLQNAGFTDVNVTPRGFLVQARAKDGSPVVMKIGPKGFTAMEVINQSEPCEDGSDDCSNSDTSDTQQ